MKTIPPLSTTAIGSMPFLDLSEAMDLVTQACPVLPHWPQLVNRHAREDMVLQAVDGLPLLVPDTDNRMVRVETEGRAQALTEFYEHLFADDLDWFAIPPVAEVGFTALLEKAGKDPSFGPDFLKAQVTGPVSFGQSIKTADNKLLLDDPDLADTVCLGLGAKAAWLAKKIRETGRTPIIFFDEPGLTGFGSGFSSLSHEQVVQLLEDAADAARATGEVILGIHVCGNTDWGMLTSTSLDIINFDAFGYLDNFLLYPEDIRKFLDRGGYLAWGIVPTRDFTGNETAAGLADKLAQGWQGLADKGLDRDLIISRSLITPACGVGSTSEDQARAIYKLLPQVADVLKESIA